ncbi:MAG: glycosyltransferase family 2 protein [Bacteroidales bacterium]|nr:glycosyltransferase family 2 protein [Bacteroidales bacterium]
MELSIIIPVYNEQKSIELVLNQLLALQFPVFVKNVEFIVVDDCSTDNSLSIVSKISDQYSQVSVFRNEKNLGKGASVRKGIENSKGDTILVRDADLELSVDDIPSMILAMDELNVEFINGSRYMAGINRPLASYRRYLVNRFFTFLTSVIINVKLTDMACGYKLFKRSLYDQIQLKENRFGFEAEILIKALRIKSNNIAEVPVHYFPRQKDGGKKLRNIDGIKILWAIFKYGLF